MRGTPRRNGNVESGERNAKRKTLILSGLSFCFIVFGRSFLETRDLFGRLSFVETVLLISWGSATVEARCHKQFNQGGPTTSSFDNASSTRSPTVKKEKAEAFGSAHKERVESEVNAWLLLEICKAEARAATAESKVEQKKMKDEAKAAELKKCEEAKAEQSIRNAELKPIRLSQVPREEAVRMNARAKEECEKFIADSHTQAEWV